MRTINRFSNAIDKYANKKYIIPVLILFVITLMMMQRSPFGSERLKELSGGTGMLDMQFGYQAAQVYAMLDLIGASGRILYTRLLCMDFVFILVYSAFQTLLITALMRTVKMPERWHKLNLIPFIRSALDIIENVLLLYIITGYPARFPLLTAIASAVTMVKLAINYGYIAIVFSLGAYKSRQSMLAKTSKNRYQESRSAI